MTINYTNLLGLAKPVTGTETGQWGDVVNDQITELIEDAVANASSISVTSGDVTLTTTTGSSNQARMAVLLITGSPGVSRNIIAPSQSKWYIVKNSSNASIVVKGSATTGVTILADTEALVFWNGSDFEVAGLVGPSSSTDNAVARFDSTTGKVIQNSGVTIDDSNNVSGVAQLNATTADLTNLEVTNIKAKDGTAAASIADSTGVISITSNPILSGGTANGVLYLNGSKVATSGSALTFDGTNFATTGTASATKLIPTGGAITGNGMYLPAANSVAITTNGAQAIYIDSSQNVGIGVTPSAWTTFTSALEVPGGALSGISANQVGVWQNCFYNSSSFKYKSTAGATLYQQSGSTHAWYTAPSGTAGTTISFTQAMTLDASGNLGIGTTSPTAALDISKASFIGGPLIGARFNTSNLRMGIGIGNTNGFPFLGVNVNNAANDNGTFDIANWASRIRLDNGVFQVQTSSASGTAGNAITWNTPLYLDSSGNLLLGGTSTTQLDGVFGQLIGSSSKTSAGLALETQYGAYLIYTDSADALIFWDSGSNAERARITSGGYFKASNAGAYVSSTGSYHEFNTDFSGEWSLRTRHTHTSNPYGIAIQYSGAAPNGTGNEFLYVYDNAALRASIRSNGGLANYSANDVNLSDRREKTNFAPAKSYLDTICAIPVQTFNYIDQSEDDPGLTLGVVAQDVQAVAPELVMESNWGTEDNPKMRLSIYQTDLQYALMKCIQELKSEVDSLKAQLKGA